MLCGWARKKDCKFRVDKVTTGKEPAAAEEESSGSSDDSNDEDKEQENVRAEPQAPKHVIAAAIPSRASTSFQPHRSTRMTALEQEMVGLRTSVTDLSAHVEVVADRQVKSEKKFLGWLRALGCACNVSPDTVSDQE